MKRIFFVFAAVALLLPAAAPTSKAADVSVDFFYNNLSGGSWIEVSDYGYCWQPDIAVSDTSWRPYADGYWAYTELGWTWVSYEDFGWATYHYGRWTRLADYGWMWVPGRNEDLEWGPAWVSWRTGGEYIGWAPLPPETVVYEGRPVTGHVDIQFNIGPAYYNFVDVRYIGEPVLRERIVATTQNVTYINQTVNVTNITYKNKIVYNYGPDVAIVNQHAARPIQRLKLERQENADINAAVKSGGLMKPQGDKLVVAAPMHITKAQGEATPSVVKTKVAKANIDRGWGVAGDEKAQNDLKQKIKTQDLKKVPPMGAAAAATGAAAAGATAAATDTNVSAGTAGVAENEKGMGKRGKKGLKENAGAASPSPAIATSPIGTATATDTEGGKLKGKPGKEGKRAGEADAAMPSSTSKEAVNTTDAATGGTPMESERAGKKGKRGNKAGGESADSVNAGASQETSAQAGASPDLGAKHKGPKSERTVGPQGQGGPAADGSPEGQGNASREGKGKHPGKNKPAEEPTASVPPQ